VALRVAAQVVGLDIDDGSLVDITGRDVSGADEVSQPLRGIGVDLVVVGKVADEFHMCLTLCRELPVRILPRRPPDPRRALNGPPSR